VRLRRGAVPWADMSHAFSVKNFQNRNFKNAPPRHNVASGPSLAICVWMMEFKSHDYSA
jgi:hypothetical protein